MANKCACTWISPQTWRNFFGHDYRERWLTVTKPSPNIEEAPSSIGSTCWGCFAEAVPAPALVRPASVFCESSQVSDVGSCSFCAVRSALIFAIRSLRRDFNAPSGHMWQKLQSLALTHPLGRQFHAQGLHRPESCNAAPLDQLLHLPGPAGALASKLFFDRWLREPSLSGWKTTCSRCILISFPG